MAKHENENVKENKPQNSQDKDKDKDINAGNATNASNASNTNSGSSLLNEIEKMQKLSAEEMQAEFDKLLERNWAVGRFGQRKPCEDLHNNLLRCLRQNRANNCRCFPAMKNYQDCVLAATNRHIDEFVKDLPPFEPTAVPESMPSSKSDYSMGRRRCWWKPWTWFR